MLINRWPKGLDRKGVADFLLKNYPITDICDTCAQLLMNQTTKIAISRFQFMEHFKIIGEKEDGTIETRGRKPLAERLAAAREARLNPDEELFNSNRSIEK